jgi:transcriptional regulator with XRE-family HTH domain
MIKNKNDLTFHELMKALRERAELSARSLSLAAGLSASYVSKIESGSVLPTISAFANIVKHLRISDKEIAYLLSTLTKDHNDK